MAEELEAISEIEQVRGDVNKPSKNQPAKDIIGFNKKMNIAMNILLAFLALICIFPFLYIIVISFSSETSLAANGFQLIPKEWSTEAYEYLCGI